MNSASTAAGRHTGLVQERAQGTPAHSAVPTASVSHGWLSGRGDSRARPFPAHSKVTGRPTLGRARSSSSERESGRSTSPSTESRKVAGSTTGMS